MEKPRPHSGRRRNTTPTPSQPNALYDDVLGGPPRYGLPLLSPRTQDYLEIFGGFHAPSFRVPFLDLPLSEADELLLDVRGGGLDYSEVFGRVDGYDAGLLEFEVVSRSDDVGGSSYGDVGNDDDAWTPDASDCLSEVSNFCGHDRTFSNRNPHMSADGEMEYKMSFHKANHGPAPFDGMRHTSQIQSIPGFSYVVNETPGIANKASHHHSKRLSSISNSHLDYGMERVKGKEEKKVLSHSSSTMSRGKSDDHDSISQKQFGRVKSFPAESFVTVSEINLQTAPSNFPPPSRPAPAFDIKTSNACGSTSSWRQNAPECDFVPDCFDVEVDGGWSTMASVAAMRETMDEVQSPLKIVKDSMERRKNSLLEPETSGLKSDANSMSKKGSLFANSMSTQKDNRVQYDNHRVNNGAESSMMEKRVNIAGENQDEVMKGKVVEGAVRSVQIGLEKEKSTVNSVFVGDDRTGWACEHSGGYDFFAESKESVRGSGVRDAMLGKDVFYSNINGLKSSESKEIRNLKARQVENDFLMTREENGIKVMEVSEEKGLGRNEVIEKHGDIKLVGKAPITAPQIMETHAGRSDAVVLEKQGGLDAVGGYVGVFDCAVRQALEHINDGEELMVSKSNAQLQEVGESLLSEKTLKEAVEREDFERRNWADGQHSVMQNEEKMAPGSYGIAKEILHFVANDSRKEDVIEQVQNEDRLPVVVEQQKVKVLPAEHYLKERLESEGARGSEKRHNKLNLHKSEGGDRAANQRIEQTKMKGDFSKNVEEIPLNWAVEQKENDSVRMDLSEREELEGMLKTSRLPQEKKKMSSTAYQMEEEEEEIDEATKLEDIGNCPSESCRSSSNNEAAPEQGTIDGSQKEAEKYVHTNENLAPKHDKASTLEHENPGQHEAVNESEDDIEWEIIDEGLCEVVDVRELGFLNQARENITVDEVSVPHYFADAQVNLQNLNKAETHPVAIATQLNKHNPLTEDVFNSRTTEWSELLNERTAHHSKQDLKKSESDFFKASEAVHEEQYVDGKMMDIETAVSIDKTNCSISCEEEVMESKDDKDLYDVPLHQGKEVLISSRVNFGCDGKTDQKMIRATSLPDSVFATAQEQSTAKPEEKKEKRAVPEGRDTIRLNREQEAELERVRRIEEEREGKRATKR